MSDNLLPIFDFRRTARMRELVTRPSIMMNPFRYFATLYMTAMPGDSADVVLLAMIISAIPASILSQSGIQQTHQLLAIRMIKAKHWMKAIKHCYLHCGAYTSHSENSYPNGEVINVNKISLPEPAGKSTNVH